MSSKKAPPPAGIVIGSGKRHWRVGKLLGDGACGAVHELVPTTTTKTSPASSGGTAVATSAAGGKGKKGRTVAADNDSSSSRYVIKLARDPPPKKSTAKTKRKKTAEERNADLISWENRCYNVMLMSLRGTYIPETPRIGERGQPPAYGNADGYRYLVMERMAAPLSSLPGYFRSHPTLHGTPLIGAVAVKILDCLEVVHGKRHLFVDVKMDNVMLNATPPKSVPRSASGASSVARGIAESVRLVDLGLVVHYLTDRGPRDDEFPDAQVVGTPLYASLNVLEGHTASRRDDVEALGYVVADLLLRMSSPSSSSSSSSSDGQESSALPWRGGRNDEEMLQLKQRALRSGTLYEGMDPKDAATMKEYMTAVRGIGYGKKPPYDELRTVLGRLRGCAATSSSSAGRKAASGTKRASTNRSSGKSARSTRARKSETEDVASAAIVIDGSDSDDDEFCGEEEDDASDDAKENNSVLSEMDWEPEVSVGDEAKAKATAPSKKASSSAPPPCLRLRFLDGPTSGGTFELRPDVVVTLGRDSGKKRASSKSVTNGGNGSKSEFIPILADDEVSANHARLVVQSRRKGTANSVKVSDLRSTNGTFINKAKLPSGGSKQAFRGDKIKLGNSTLIIEAM